MPMTIAIKIGNEVLRAMRKGAPVRIALVAAGDSPRGARSPAPARRGRKPGQRKSGPRKGGGRRGEPLAARLVAWAGSQKKAFGARDVMKALGVKRAHAALLLSGAVRSKAIRRANRGVYVA